MNMLKLKLVLFVLCTILSSYNAYAMEETEVKKPVSRAKPSSEGQKIVPSSKPIGSAKAAFLKAHKFPIEEDLTKRLVTRSSNRSKTA